MEKYYTFSKSRLIFHHVPISFAKLIINKAEYFDKKKLTYYPECSQKSKVRIFFDQAWHILKYGFPNTEYYLYGLDVKGSRCSDYIRELWHVENLIYFQNYFAYGIKVARNHDYSYNGCLRDKWIFALLMEKMGMPTPKTFGLIKDNRLIINRQNNETGKSCDLGILRQYNLNVMCKPIEDNGGNGIFHLIVDRGKLYVKGMEISDAEFSDMVKGGIYILQDYINNQHEDMKKLAPESINTLRFTLVQTGNGESKVLGVMCLMGAHGLECSNWHFGGVCANVKSDGTIDKYGYSMSDKRVERHPDTHVVFDGYKIPYYEEALALAKSCMKIFYGIKSVGWDIAITSDGPIVIEGNDDWGLAAHQMVENQGWAERYFKYLD